MGERKLYERMLSAQALQRFSAFALALALIKTPPGRVVCTPVLGLGLQMMGGWLVRLVWLGLLVWSWSGFLCTRLKIVDAALPSLCLSLVLHFSDSFSLSISVCLLACCFVSFLFQLNIYWISKYFQSINKHTFFYSSLRFCRIYFFRFSFIHFVVVLFVHCISFWFYSNFLNSN